VRNHDLNSSIAKLKLKFHRDGDPETAARATRNREMNSEAQARQDAQLGYLTTVPEQTKAFPYKKRKNKYY
jgi:hypothetical protein